MERRTYNPCNECLYGIERRNGSGNEGICKICEFKVQQQEIEELKTRLADIEISADRISRDIYESDKVHIYISEIKARCGKFGANTTKILLDRLKDLTADKNKHTELLKQAREALEYCILSGCKPAQGVAESVISSITQQIGGTEK